MNRAIELNRPAVTQKIRMEDMSVRVYTSYPYISGGIINQASVVNPIYRYAKNFKKHGKEFCLIMISDDRDTTKVEKYFSDIVKSIRKEDLKSLIVGGFSYLKSNYKENK